MVHPTKEAAVAELSNRFSGSGGAVLTEYRGLTVAQLKQLRRSLAEHATYAVVKNTLTKIAAERAGHRLVHRRAAQRSVGGGVHHRRPGRGGQGVCGRSRG